MMEAIILAGGFGTRLKSVVNDVPKPMAPIGQIPFLSYLLDYLSHYGVLRVILSTGYMHEVIERYYGNYYQGIELIYSFEHEPLGTGGAIKAAIGKAQSNKIFILNGDTFFQVNLQELYEYHVAKEADLTVALKKMNNFDRYGTVEVDQGRVAVFHEKRPNDAGMINGGVYLINKQVFSSLNLPDKFSFETDVLQVFMSKLRFYGYVSDKYFIDIGIPEDYMRAQVELGEIIE